MKEQSLSSIEKAVIILDCFLDGNKPLTLKEIIEHTGFPKSTVFHLLVLLKKANLIAQHSTDGKYYMGYHIFELGSAAHKSYNIIHTAKRPMKKLAETIHMNVHLTAKRDGSAVLLAHEEPSKATYKMVLSKGSSLPLHSTAPGKIFLANMSKSEVQNYIKEVREINPRIDMEALLRELEQVRTKGYSMDAEEYGKGRFGIAAPIYNAEGYLMYALSAVDFISVHGMSKIRKYVPHIIKTADYISEAYGYKNSGI